MRRLFLGLALAILASAAAVPAELPTIVVEDWSRQVEGRTGIPEGWKGHGWGSPKYDFAIVAEGSDRVLRLRSRGDNSTISKETRVDVTKLPVMVWRWKVVTLPARGATAGGRPRTTRRPRSTSPFPAPRRLSGHGSSATSGTRPRPSARS